VSGSACRQRAVVDGEHPPMKTCARWPRVQRRPNPRCRGKIVDIVPRAREALRASGGIGLVSLIREEGESL
jgi:hypothetical protein